MRLIRFGAPGAEIPGLLLSDGRVVNLRHHFPKIPDINEHFFRDGWLERLRTLQAASQPLTARLGSPIASPQKIICLGKNYADHARETGSASPSRPLLFCKTANTVSGPHDPIVLPRSCGMVDWEVELAVVIARPGKRIARQQAWDFVAGLMVMNDVSAREAQFADGQWFRGKSCDTFAPMGPALVTLDEVPNPAALSLTSLVNGVPMQSGDTRDLIHDIPALLEYISTDITLVPGDVISTGTPAGVGYFRTPPIRLQAGDVVECRISGIGSLVNPVVAG